MPLQLVRQKKKSDFAKRTQGARARSSKGRKHLCGLVLSDTIFRIFESTAVAGSGVLALLLGLTAVDFNRRIGQFSVRQSGRLFANFPVRLQSARLFDRPVLRQEP